MSLHTQMNIQKVIFIKKHNFKLVSIYIDSENMYTDKCTYCGLEHRWNSDWECDKHYTHKSQDS